mgnify:CR=1 FL=1
MPERNQIIIIARELARRLEGKMNAVRKFTLFFVDVAIKHVAKVDVNPLQS